MISFDFPQTISDDSEAAFNSAAWEENSNYKLHIYLCFQKEPRRDGGKGQRTVRGWGVGESTWQEDDSSVVWC